MYAINFLAVAMSALVSADTLAGEISSGAMQAIATKPIRRLEVVLGKWIGFAGLLALYLLLMIRGLLVIGYVQAGYIVPNLPLGAAVIYLEGLLVMSLTLACSSAFSTLATGGIMFSLYGVGVIGGFVEQVGALLRNSEVVNVGIVSSLIMPGEALLRYAIAQMTAAGGLAGGPVLVISRPSEAMVVYAVLYVLACLGLAAWHFNRRDL
jgi:ABC-type transport system involved in multi-copper enzyme maturation permease subunit